MAILKQVIYVDNLCKFIKVKKTDLSANFFHSITYLLRALELKEVYFSNPSNISIKDGVISIEKVLHQMLNK